MVSIANRIKALKNSHSKNSKKANATKKNRMNSVHTNMTNARKSSRLGNLTNSRFSLRGIKRPRSPPPPPPTKKKPAHCKFAYAAKNEIMSHVSPEGPVYQAGTLSGNPVAMSAGIAQLSKCAEEGFYEDQQHRTLEFISSINSFCASKDYPIKIVSIGSIFWFSFAGNKSIKSADQINPEMNHFSRLYNLLLNKGVYIGPSGYEVGFVSFAHDVSVLKMASKLFCEAIDQTFTNS